MSWVGLEDTSEGIRVTASDAPEVDGEFVPYDLALLDRAVPHTIRFWIKPADINSLQFRSSVPGFSGPAGGGYLFDNVSVITSNGPGPPGCDLVIDKEADAGTVIAGVNAGYTITVRNRGRGSAGNVRVCDRVPRGMTFVGASRKLSRLGGRRCLVIPRLGPGQRVSLHVDFRVDGSAPPGTVANIADVTPGVEPPGSPEAAGSGGPAALARSPGSARGGQKGHGHREDPGKAGPAERCRIASIARHRLLWPRAPRRAA